jgi:glycerol-3-phosphate acyltransferase PlsY
MKPGLALGLVVGAYLLGSISFSYLIVRVLQGLDVRTVGSGNAGATNVLRAAGSWAAVAVLLLDVGKGVAAVFVPRLLGAPPAVVGAAAVAVVLGHVFPIFFGLRGGKGVATAAGALGTMSPWAMALGLATFSVVVAWKRYVSLASIATAASLPFWIYLVHRLGLGDFGGGWLSLAAVAIAILVIFKHASNIRRLRRGQELRLGAAGAAPALEAFEEARDER